MLEIYDHYPICNSVVGLYTTKSLKDVLETVLDSSKYSIAPVTDDRFEEPLSIGVEIAKAYKFFMEQTEPLKVGDEKCVDRLLDKMNKGDGTMKGLSVLEAQFLKSYLYKL